LLKIDNAAEVVDRVRCGLRVEEALQLLSGAKSFGSCLQVFNRDRQKRTILGKANCPNFPAVNQRVKRNGEAGFRLFIEDPP